MIYALYNDFGEIFCVTKTSQDAYVEMLEYLKEKSEYLEQYIDWCLELKYNYRKDSNDYGVFGVAWAKKEGR